MATTDLERMLVEKTMNEFPKFWYESNACWGYVADMEELSYKCGLQIDREHGALDSVDEFLDASHQRFDGGLNFGTRREHTGKTTLRDFLESHGVDYSSLYENQDGL